MQNIKSLQKQYKPILDFLHQWQDQWHLYDLMNFHSTEFYYPLEEFEILKHYFDVDLSSYFNDKLISFATDGGGGHYCFWLYPDLKSEPPIIFIDGHGEEEFLASNLNDFVNRLINELDFCAGWICEGDDVEKTFKEDMLWELADAYQKEKGKEFTETEIEKLFLLDRQLFKEKATKIITLKTTKQLKSDFKNHPKFDDWKEKVQQKNDEIYKENQTENFIEQSIEEQIAGYDGIVKNKILSKKELIILLKEEKPNLVKTEIFQKWAKK